MAVPSKTEPPGELMCRLICLALQAASSWANSLASTPSENMLEPI